MPWPELPSALTISLAATAVASGSCVFSGILGRRCQSWKDVMAPQHLFHLFTVILGICTTAVVCECGWWIDISAGMNGQPAGIPLISHVAILLVSTWCICALLSFAMFLNSKET